MEHQKTRRARVDLRRRFHPSPLLALAAGLVAILGPSAPAAQAAAIYDVRTSWSDTNLPPGGEGKVDLWVRNVGDATGTKDLLVKGELPEGVTATGIHYFFSPSEDYGEFFCLGEGTETVECLFPGGFLPALVQAPGINAGQNTPQPTGYMAPVEIEVEIDPGAAGTGTNTATVSGGGAVDPDIDVDQIAFGPPSAFGLVPGSFVADFYDAAFPFGEEARQAGDHPFEVRVDFDFTARTTSGSSGIPLHSVANGTIKTAEVTLPRGMIGNPEATPKCDPVLFAELGASLSSSTCPSNTQVGYLNVITSAEFRVFRREELSRVPIYNLEPPLGEAADFGFNAGGLVQGHIYPTVDPAQNYAIKTVTPEISSLVPVAGSQVTFWGVPGDPAHDKFRYFPKVMGGKSVGASFGAAGIRPLLTNPFDCGFDNGGTRTRLETYEDPGVFTLVEEYGNPHNVTGCDDPRFRFEPDVALQPTSKAAGVSTGLNVHLEVPQRNDEVEDADELYAQNEDVQGISTPPVKKAVVVLPEGMTVNPAAAQGLGHCTPEQIGLGTDKPVTCPDSSQYGTLTLRTPILPSDEQPEGFVYIAQQNDNPFHNFLSLYLVIQEPDRGILVKVPGRVDLDPQTGQITTTFDDLPQFPLKDMQINLKGGLRAGLVNPQTCGKKTIRATFYSWQDPSTPHTVDSSFNVTHNLDGAACYASSSERPFEPRLSGGTINNRAGSFSPMELQLTRADQDQELLSAEGTAPPGLLASLKGVGRCSDAAIAVAASPERTGTQEIGSPSCPASSLVGSVDAGAGVGQVLTYVKGKIYLAGPYKGAPLSGVAIVPAVAGPFDLGTIVTRAPGYINPKTAEVSIKTDELPLIFKGVPVRVRDIRVHLDRPNFTLNPTNCEPFALMGALFSSEGKSKASTTPFQAAECASLGFKPSLTTRLFGGTKRGAHPKFRGLFKARSGDANVSGAVVTLPRSEFLDQSHIRTVCTRVQFAADQCPSAAIYGHAVAKTPLLDEELKGPVYLRSSNNKLPDLVADLHGIIDVEVSGRIDSIRGGIRTTFESIPDAPVESFEITVQGGRKGVLVNSRDVCARTYRLNAEFTAQNGKETTLRPKLQANCKGKASKAKRAKRSARSR
jgi:hypothetical protein